MQIILKIFNRGVSEICGIPVNEYVTVFKHAKFFQEHMTELIDKAEDLELIDFYGQPIPAEEKIEYLSASYNVSVPYISEGIYEQVNYNVYSGYMIISKVRTDAVTEGLSGVNATELAVKCSQLSALCQIGMLKEASYAVLAIEEDAFMTAERKQLYFEIAQSADQLPK